MDDRPLPQLVALLLCTEVVPHGDAGRDILGVGDVMYAPFTPCRLEFLVYVSFTGGSGGYAFDLRLYDVELNTDSELEHGGFVVDRENERLVGAESLSVIGRVRAYGPHEIHLRINNTLIGRLPILISPTRIPGVI